MARDFYLNGETMVSVKGNVNNSTIAQVQQLGLADKGVVFTINTKQRDLIVDSWGPEVPVDVQTFLADIQISMTLIHFDPVILHACLVETLGAPAALLEGVLNRAGKRLGGGSARYQGDWHYISLNLASPVLSKPYRFYNTYLTGPALSWPLGTEKSVVQLNWRAVPYTVDPWGGGTGAAGHILWDNTLDT